MRGQEGGGTEGESCLVWVSRRERVKERPLETGRNIIGRGERLLLLLSYFTLPVDFTSIALFFFSPYTLLLLLGLFLFIYRSTGANDRTKSLVS